MRISLILTLLFSFIFSNAQDNILQQLLIENKNQFGDVLNRPEQYYVQIIYSQINRDENNAPSFNSYNYNLDEKKYYHPASTIKMPISFLALEKINRLNIIGLDKNSIMINGVGSYHPRQRGRYLQ